MPRAGLSLLFATLLLSACGDKDADDTGEPGTTDGGSADGGSADGGSADGGSADGGSADGGSADGGSADGGATEPVDADGDGFAAVESGGDDCDDDDETVFPGAEETCNEVDDDCDGETDEEPVDGTTFYVDADGDGFGDPDRAVDACALTEGLSEDGSDCDDDEPTVNPDGVEVCDGVDNDCDGDTDANRVPTDHATLQEAVDALADGSDICVEPGTYTEQLDLSGRTLSFTGQLGAAWTIFDVGSRAPMLTLDGVGGTTTPGDVSLAGFTVTGADLSADSSELQGGFAQVKGGTLSLSDLLVTDLSGEMRDGGSIEGLLVYAEDSALALANVTIDEVQLSMSGSSEDTESLYGGLVRVERGSLDIAGLTVTNLQVTGDAGRSFSGITGAVLSADNGSASSSDGSGPVLDIRDLVVLDSSIDLQAADRAQARGAFVQLWDASGTVTGMQISDSSIRLAEAEDTSVLAVIYGFGNDGGLQWADVQLSGLQVEVSGSDSGYVYGLLRSWGVGLSGVRLWSNTVLASTSSADGTISALLDQHQGDIDHLDVRANALQADDAISALVMVESSDDSSTMSNFVLAGNELVASNLNGGLLSAGVESGSLSLRNGDIVGNQLTLDATWGGLVVGGSEGAGVVSMVNVQLVDNSHEGEGEVVGVYSWDGGTSLTTAYCNLYGLSGSDSNYGDLVGSDDNIGEDPLYTGVSDSDPTAWDLSLASGSPAIDAGSPDLSDDDGSTSDMGAYGGPGGTDW